jgi:hypothetical protein
MEPGSCLEKAAGICRGVGREPTHGSENACCELALWTLELFGRLVTATIATAVAVAACARVARGIGAGVGVVATATAVSGGAVSSAAGTVVIEDEAGRDDGNQGKDNTKDGFRVHWYSVRPTTGDRSVSVCLVRAVGAQGCSEWRLTDYEFSGDTQQSCRAQPQLLDARREDGGELTRVASAATRG